MNKVALGTLVAAGLIIAAYFVAGLVIEARVKARTTYWAQAVNANVSVGEQRDEVESWLRRRFSGPSYYDPHAQVLSFEPESLPDLPPACTSWDITVEVQFGPDNRVISRDVAAGESGCL
jgi:hypothetical protein